MTHQVATWLINFGIIKFMKSVFSCFGPFSPFSHNLEWPSLLDPCWSWSHIQTVNRKKTHTHTQKLCWCGHVATRSGEKMKHDPGGPVWVWPNIQELKESSGAETLHSSLLQVITAAVILSSKCRCTYVIGRLPSVAWWHCVVLKQKSTNYNDNNNNNNAFYLKVPFKTLKDTADYEPQCPWFKSVLCNISLSQRVLSSHHDYNLLLTSNKHKRSHGNVWRCFSFWEKDFLLDMTV